MTGSERPRRFADLLRSYRISSRVSQEDLAERAGISAKAISTLERGVRLAPRRETVALLAEALALTTEEHRGLEEAAARARMRSRVAPQTGKSGSRHNLPAQVTSFIGRDRELSDLSRMITRHRLTTITGTGGIGKTRLALEVARPAIDAFTDGVWLIDFSGLDQASAVVSQIASVFRVRVDDSDPLGSLIEALAPLNVLLLLDNCEHVLETVVPTVTALLRTAAKVTIVATSRERLRVSGEAVYRLPPLAVPMTDAPVAIETAPNYSAVALFIDRSAGLEVGHPVTATSLDAVIDICRKLDGLPLAIELAATRLPMLGMAALRSQLNSRLASLSGGLRDLPPRQRTLTATIDWSYNLLDANQQTLFRRLAIFAGGCTQEAIEKVCCFGELQILGFEELLWSLIDKSMVTLEGEDDACRYYLLDSMRDYAYEKAATSGEASDLIRRHCLWAAEFADRADSAYFSKTHQQWIADVRTELDNIRLALTRALAVESSYPEIVGRIIGGLRSYWFRSGWVAEQQLLAEKTVLQLNPNIHQGALAKLFLVRALVLAASEKIATVRHAITLQSELRDDAGLVPCYLHLAFALFQAGRYTAAEQALGWAWTYSIRGGINTPLLQATICDVRAEIAFAQGKLQQAQTFSIESLRIAEPYGDDDLLWTIRRTMAETEAALGNFSIAQELVEKELASGSLHKVDAAVLWGNLAGYRIALNDASGARVAARVAVEGSRGSAIHIFVFSVQHLATATALLGQDATRCARLLGFVDAQLARTGLTRDYVERLSEERLLSSLQQQLDDDELQRCLSEGALLSVERAAEEALAG
jgi:predicted ATPase/DNA-binding XRE family transcriptional regulator